MGCIWVDTKGYRIGLGRAIGELRGDGWGRIGEGGDKGAEI